MRVKLRERDPIFQCWRVAAIYRCVLRYGMSPDVARAHLRALDPTGRKDHLLDILLMGATPAAPRSQARSVQVEPVRLAA
jgi:hypothetical protein